MVLGYRKIATDFSERFIPKTNFLDRLGIIPQKRKDYEKKFCRKMDRALVNPCFG
jgi:hypothetical protein